MRPTDDRQLKIMSSLQAEIESNGLEIIAHLRAQTPSVFRRKNITGRLMGWSMRNEALKVQMFRFVDVLPTLHSSREIARHAYEYLGRDADGLPAPVRWAIRHSPKIPWLAALAARK